MTRSSSNNIFLITVLAMVMLYLFSETYLQTYADSGGYIGVKKDGVDSVDGLRSTYDVAISPDGNFVYGAGRGDKAVAVFSRDPSSGALTSAKRGGPLSYLAPSCTAERTTMMA